ncbi:hypothetical protein B0T26DRAFT_860122 [Lasiosphaeria miniovina]|uniref:RNase H type-1 domain-containing protein n=1 Tax=Lasiosphaeria miniovina TaxID=1954250 RepID=A0AA40DRL3_9PEZI|nr:uncharacterized protein B0T26DRAFT_860122 [Lasiosphaeria miniovina]KAK0709413.1 hypothetical protein B0T26DRAFT_860122 [Lasiosphaeria miniovina]
MAGLFPTKFKPLSQSAPLLQFSGQRPLYLITRLTLEHDTSTVIVFTGGTCLPVDGLPDSKAGWAFWHGVGPKDEPLVVSGRLETTGPFGDTWAQGRNRAELRAVIGALRFRHWPSDGIRTLVIASSSEHVVETSTNYITTLVEFDYLKRGAGIKDWDLWHTLLFTIRQYQKEGMAVQFWLIPREWNTVAVSAARKACAQEDAPSVWTDVVGRGPVLAPWVDSVDVPDEYSETEVGSPRQPTPET